MDKLSELRDRVIEDGNYVLELIDEGKVAGGAVILRGLVDSLEMDKEKELNANATNENV